MTAIRSRLAIGAGLAALILASATVGAGAASLIRSKDIADDSIRSIDIRNGTLASRDVKDGSLRGADIAGGLKTGTGPDRVVTWGGTYDSDGGNNGEIPLVTSTDTIPANSLVRGLDLTVDGITSSCTGNLWVEVRVHSPRPDEELPLAARMVSPNDGGSYETHDDAVSPQVSDVPLEVYAHCSDGSAIPTFGFTVTLAITQLDDAPTGTFE